MIFESTKLLIYYQIILNITWNKFIWPIELTFNHFLSMKEGLGKYGCYSLKNRDFLSDFFVQKFFYEC